jgi:hypothetical protein
MSNTRTVQNVNSQPLPNAEARSLFRTKTVATWLSTEELEEVESAAKRDGKSLAEWLRDTILREAQQRPADPVELILAELLAIRLMLLNLYRSTAETAAEGKQLRSETVLKIRDEVNAVKFQEARKMLQKFSQGEQNRSKS